MKHVLFTHSYFYKMDAKQWQNQTPFLPLGTIYAASLLRENKYRVSLFDVALKESPQEIKPILEKENPEILVIYDDGFNYLTKMCLTTMREACFEMIKLAKKQGCTVIISSSDATDHAEKYLEKGADFVLFGEAEFTLLELVDFLSKKGVKEKRGERIEKREELNSGFSEISTFALQLDRLQEINGIIYNPIQLRGLATDTSALRESKTTTDTSIQLRDLAALRESKITTDTSIQLRDLAALRESKITTDASIQLRDLAALREFKKTKPRKVLNSLDELPMPAWDLVDINSYKEIWKNSKQQFALNLATTRGCPYHCNWCAKPIYGQRYNSHSPKRVVEMIDYLSKKHQVNRFWMCDDIFGLKPKWVQEFRDVLKENDLKINYYIQSRADLLLKEDTIDALVESGLEEVWIGAESGSQKILDAMDKGTTIAQIEESTKLLQAKHVKVAFFIQYGYLGETKEDINKTIALIKRLQPDNIGVSVSYPLPETPFYEKVKNQFKDKTNWKDSDDLAMLFQGTFNGKYYRKLQRYTHKEFRKTQGLSYLKKGEFLGNLRAIGLLAYYIPSAFIDRITLSKMEHSYNLN